MRIKFRCTEVCEKVDWDNRPYVSARLYLGGESNTPCAPGDHEISVRCQPGEFNVGNVYYATLEPAEAVADKLK